MDMVHDEFSSAGVEPLTRNKITFSCAQWMLLQRATWWEMRQVLCNGKTEKVFNMRSALSLQITTVASVCLYLLMPLSTCNAQTPTPFDLKILHKVGLHRVSVLLKDDLDPDFRIFFLRILCHWETGHSLMFWLTVKSQNGQSTKV